MRRVEANKANDEGRGPHLEPVSDRPARAQRAREERVWVEEERRMSERRESEKPEHWHVEKKIPVALIFAMFVQTVGLVSFISYLDARVGQLEKDGLAKEWQAERIIRIDERLTSLQNSMAELKTIIRPAPKQ